MMLRIGNRTFDWMTIGIANIAHRGGVVTLAACHGDHDFEILDAQSGSDMNELAQRFVDEGRFRQDQPGVVLGLIVRSEEDRSEAKHIAATLTRSRRVWGEWTDGSPRRHSMALKDLQQLAHRSAMKALGYGK